MTYIYAIICHRITNPLIFTVKHLLESDKSKVIIHIDRKTSQKNRKEIYSSLGEHKNLMFIPTEESIEVFWGHYSQIKVMLLLMEKALEYNFRYFSLISGDDIPIKSNTEREKFFERNYAEKVEFIGCNPKNDGEQRLYIDYPNFFFKKDHSLLKKIKRNVYIKYKSRFHRKDITHLPKIYKGSNWFTLTNKAIEYVFHYISENPKYVASFERSICGDEIFFQTIIFNNAELRRNIYGIESNMKDCEMGGRYIDWTTGPDFPRSLDENDIRKVTESNLIFARKFKHDAPTSLLKEVMRG